MLRGVMVVMSDAFARLHHLCARLGTVLFTVTSHDLAQGLFRGAYTTHPVEYPLQRTQPSGHEAW